MASTKHPMFMPFMEKMQFRSILTEMFWMAACREKKQALVIAWVMMHEEELKANYELMLDGQMPFRIEPLK